VLMVAAYPLILLADVLTQKLLRGGNEKQAIIDLFNTSNTLEQRVLIIVLAVTIAPVAEEFLFRFFLYGVVKRYLGRVVGILVSAALFAAVHAHLPSFAPLFVLGVCFAIAYEWSGSILVSMTMHAFFNAITLTALAFPELNPQ
jgi:membrane protease YdiL (CAAX protease family)